MMKPSAKPLNAASGNKGTKFLVPELPKVPKAKNAVRLSEIKYDSFEKYA